MRQKFGKLSFVKVCDEMPPHMQHFQSGFEGVVAGTYSQIYRGTNIDDYSLYVIKDGCIVNRSSWYEVDQLTLMDNQDRDKAEQMIEDYNFRDKS